MLLIETAVVQQQGIPLVGGKPAGQAKVSHRVETPGVTGPVKEDGHRGPGSKKDSHLS
jgi:hypothetical protein